MELLEKLLAIQLELNAPKSQWNDYGKYNYRNCEDILEAVKPLCKANNVVLTLCDSIVTIGNRFYVEAKATLTDLDKTGMSISNTAYAREEDSKKGMDGSQVTGAASSYARKYALNGLFCIDDEKDADYAPPSNSGNGKGNNTSQQKNAAQSKSAASAKASEKFEMPPTDKDGYWHCADCNEIIKNTTGRDGNKILPNELVVLAMKKYGRCLCADCMKKAKAAQDATTA